MFLDDLALPITVRLIMQLAGPAPSAPPSGLVILLPSLVSAGIGGLVSWSIFHAGRLQGRRNNTLDLYREYYSKDFAKDRVDAERFFKKHQNRSWTSVNPYDLDDPEDWRGGYSAVVRYFHRVSVLYDLNELNRTLAAELLSRELGYWFAVSFLRMRSRTDWWTKASIFRLGAIFRRAHRIPFRQGYLDGCRSLKRQRHRDAADGVIGALRRLLR